MLVKPVSIRADYRLEDQVCGKFTLPTRSVATSHIAGRKFMENLVQMLVIAIMTIFQRQFFHSFGCEVSL